MDIGNDNGTFPVKVGPLLQISPDFLLEKVELVQTVLQSAGSFAFKCGFLPKTTLVITLQMSNSQIRLINLQHAIFPLLMSDQVFLARFAGQRRGVKVVAVLTMVSCAEQSEKSRTGITCIFMANTGLAKGISTWEAQNTEKGVVRAVLILWHEPD